MIQGTSSSASTTSTSASSATTNTNSVMGKDSFLTLLLAQLQNQDPLNPMESYEFTGQLAQFTQIEQLTDIKDLVESGIESNNNLASTIQSTLAVNMIGKEVTINTSTLKFDGTNGVKFMFDAPTEAETLGISVYNSDGNLVKNLDMTSFETGTNTVTWDGKDSDGNTVESGDYYVSVAYKNEEGSSYNLQTYINGKITGLKYKSGETYVVVNGQEIKLSNLKEILGGSDDGD